MIRAPPLLPRPLAAQRNLRTPPAPTIRSPATGLTARNLTISRASAGRNSRRAWRRYSEFGNSATECELELGTDLPLHDLGDLSIKEQAADYAAAAVCASLTIEPDGTLSVD